MRHLKFVHKNLELDIPAMLKISQREEVKEEPFEICSPTIKTTLKCKTLFWRRYWNVKTGSYTTMSN